MWLEDQTEKGGRNVAKVEIMSELCKNCGLCMIYCPREVLSPGQYVNKKGFTPVEMVKGEDECIGCALCATVCPEAAIEVYK